MNNLIPADWREHLSGEVSKDYFLDLSEFLKKEYTEEKIFPPKKQVFEALSLTPLKDVKVVIIGQDPYHGEGQAHGLAFSVQKGVKIPPSLKNIYKELNADIGMEAPAHGNLVGWAQQGVLLLNAVLTVRESTPGSHQKRGWEIFTDKVVDCVKKNNENVVFLLWGNYAKKKGEKIDRQRHLVLESAHPSPFSVKKFLGNQHFSKTNAFLEKKGLKPIDWNKP